MESSFSLHALYSGGLPTLDSPFWSPEEEEDTNKFSIPMGIHEGLEDVRLPKKRRYCGEDTTRHSWDNRGFMSTEPPTPVLLEQQELVDNEPILPFGQTYINQRLPISQNLPTKLQLPMGAISHSHSVKHRNPDSSPGSSATRVRWLEADDKLLIQLVSELGNNWPLIASKMEGRTSKQVKERWTNQLDPTISTEPWTADDDQQLVELIRELGHSWCEISRRMKGRTESMVKNRFHANLRKRFGSHIFDPSLPLPPLTFKPKSIKSKKAALSNDIRAAAAVAAEKAATLKKGGSQFSISAMPVAESFTTDFKFEE
jgi:hypothetical protein